MQILMSFSGTSALTSLFIQTESISNGFLSHVVILGAADQCNFITSYTFLPSLKRTNSHWIYIFHTSDCTASNKMVTVGIALNLRNTFELLESFGNTVLVLDKTPAKKNKKQTLICDRKPLSFARASHRVSAVLPSQNFWMLVYLLLWPRSSAF